MRREIITLHNLPKYVEFEPGEVWKPLNDYYDKWGDTYRYFISSHGRVYGTVKRKLIKPFATTNKDNHLNVMICTGQRDDKGHIKSKPTKLHTLVAQHFLIQPDDYSPKKYVVHHVNLDPLINTASNLMYMPIGLHTQLHRLYGRCRKNKPA